MAAISPRGGRSPASRRIVSTIRRAVGVEGEPTTTMTERPDHLHAASSPGSATPRELPPGQSPYAGRIIALTVFFGVILGIVVIALLPEPTVDFGDTIRLHPREVVTVRLFGERGNLEILNEGPLPVHLSSPTAGAPLDGTIELGPGGHILRDIRGAGAIDVRNHGDAVTTVRWRGGGPEPTSVTADPPRTE